MRSNKRVYLVAGNHEEEADSWLLCAAGYREAHPARMFRDVVSLCCIRLAGFMCEVRDSYEYRTT